VCHYQIRKNQSTTRHVFKLGLARSDEMRKTEHSVKKTRSDEMRRRKKQSMNRDRNNGW